VTIRPTPALLAALSLGAASLLGGCHTSRPAAPVGETPEQISGQIDRASMLVRDAQRLEVAGHDKDAANKYREAIAMYRELPVAWNNLGRLMMKESNNLAAAEAFKTAAELSPTDPRPLHNLGTLWESLGYLDDAARWYGEALVRDENYLPALRRIAIVEEIRNKPDATTLDRIRRAQLIEQDPWWKEKFKRDRLRFEDLINTSKTDSMSKMDPVYRTDPTPPVPTAPAAPVLPAPKPDSMPH
jgi:tetratricopeptide (TPR) repeat protein